MPIRRSALSALCLVIFGTAIVQGQENDPFAEWDRDNGRMAAKRTAAQDSKASVTYFSPRTEETPSSESPKALALKTAQIRMRERSPARPTVATAAATKAPTGASPAAVSTAKPAVATKSVGKPFPPKSVAAASNEKSPAAVKSSPPGALTAAAKDIKTSAAARLKNLSAAQATEGSDERPIAESQGIVRQASLQENDTPADSPVIRTASQPDDLSEEFEPAEEGNPFADFLNNARKKTANAPQNELFEPSAEMMDGEEKAEPLVNRKSAAAKTPAVSNTNSRKPRSQFMPDADPPNPDMPKAGMPKTVADTSAMSARPGMPAAATTASASKLDDGPQSPGITVQWIRRGEFNVGQECDVDLVVQNTSKFVVQSVLTEAVIPDEVEILESTPAPMQGSEKPTWTFGELKPGETRTVSLKMIPRERGGVRLDAFVRLTGYSSTEFSVQEPMLAVEVVGPESVEVGQQVSYVVRVNNPGTGIASNVIIQAAIPAGLEHRSGRILSIEIGTLNPGESRQAKLSVTAVEGGAQNLAVRAIADGDLTEETLANVIVSEPQLSIEIAGPPEQMTGRTSDYTMTVSNAGNVPSANVRAKYRLPDGFEFVTADRGGKYSKVDHSIEWFVGTLQPEEESSFLLTLRATETGELVHQAGVISEHGHVTTCDYSTTVEGMAALELKISASDKQLIKGENVKWEVHIRNTGSRAATNVGMSCELPSGVQLLEADGPSAHIAENGVMVFRSLPAIEPGEDVVYEISAQCIRSGNHSLRLRVASESIAEPLIGEQSATVSDR